MEAYVANHRSLQAIELDLWHRKTVAKYWEEPHGAFGFATR
jgi:hypothetical protein